MAARREFSEATALRAIVEGVEAEIGERFFPLLVQHLATALGAQYAFITRFLNGSPTFRSRAVWARDRISPNFESPLAGTPCEAVLNGELVHHSEGLRAQFPEDALLVDWGAESYCGLPLLDASGEVTGHLAIVDDRPMFDGPDRFSILRIFAARAVAEIDRLSSEKALAESEERLRDLFEEAPIAYVHEGLDTKFIRANRSAMRTLGITPDQVTDMYGKSFIPDTPEAQRRVKEAFESVGRGTDTSGVVLELRRKDNGKPLWIQWWSNPDRSGTYTRTMFVDITERVLVEQEKARLAAHNVYLQEEIKTEHNFEEIVGNSPAIKKVFKAIAQVAPTDATAMISGETGTGKELIARAIHSLSKRRERVLVKVNCAAIPAGLIESEMFGHEKGAFTGALSRKIGRFELADGGSIFLDEVGEIPLELQSKLLRIIQEGEFERLGSTKTHTVDVRIIAATNRDLAAAVEDREFRADLFYRLNVFPIPIPSLRDRKDDIPLLVRHFVSKYGAKMGKRIESVSQTAIESFKSYPWPGNIRELQNVIERAMILSQSTELELGDWLPRKSPSPAGSETLTLQEIERAHVLSVLDLTNWRVSGERGAAELLGLKPTTLEARMKKLGIRREYP